MSNIYFSDSNQTLISTDRLIWLYELAIIAQEKAEAEDSSWNYDINGLKNELKQIKSC